MHFFWACRFVLKDYVTSAVKLLTHASLLETGFTLLARFLFMHQSVHTSKALLPDVSCCRLKKIKGSDMCSPVGDAWNTEVAQLWTHSALLRCNHPRCSRNVIGDVERFIYQHGCVFGTLLQLNLHHLASRLLIWYFGNFQMRRLAPPFWEPPICFQAVLCEWASSLICLLRQTKHLFSFLLFLSSSSAPVPVPVPAPQPNSSS